MKAIIESTIKEVCQYRTHIEQEFLIIINLILSSTYEGELRRYFKPNFEYFKVGFGSNHMWVKQINLKTRELYTDRIIFVEF
jgi:hypothetical protein